MKFLSNFTFLIIFVQAIGSFALQLSSDDLLKFNSQLITASHLGMIGKVNSLLQLGANVNCIDENKDSPLHHACANGFTNVAEKLIQSGANLNAKNSDGDCPIQFAAIYRFVDIINQFIQSGADLNCKNNQGQTALMFAAAMGFKDVLDALLNANANPNIQDNNGNTALIFAAKSNYYDIVVSLLQKNANRYLKNAAGNQASDYATNANIVPLLIEPPIISATKDDNITQIKALIAQNVNVNSLDGDGKTALIWASINGFADAVYLLLFNNGDKTIKDNSGRAAIDYANSNDNQYVKDALNINPAYLKPYDISIWAAAYGYLEVMKLMIKIGIPIDIGQEISQITPLQYAAAFNQISVLNYLIQNGADINYLAAGGQNALSFAIKNNVYSSVEILINAGADLTIGYLTSLSIAADAAPPGDLRIFSLILEHYPDVNRIENDGVQNTPLILAVYYNKIECVRLLLTYDPNRNKINSHGDTAFTLSKSAEMTQALYVYNIIEASKQGNYSMVVSLLNKRVAINSQDINGETALMWAARNDYLNIVQLLLEFGIDKNIQNKNGETALDIVNSGNKNQNIITAISNDPYQSGNAQKLLDAIKANDVNTVNYYLDRNANIEYKNNLSDTAIAYAAYYNSIDIANILIARGANLNNQNNIGQTPLIYSVMQNNLVILEALLKAGANMEITDRQGLTAFLYGVYYDKMDALKLLVKYGANIQASANGQNAYHMMVFNKISPYIMGTYLKRIGVWLKSDNYGYYPLSYAESRFTYEEWFQYFYYSY